MRELYDNIHNNFILYIKLTIVYISVYTSMIYMFIALGLNVYASIVVSMIVSFFVHETLYSTSKSEQNSNSDMIQIADEPPLNLKIVRANQVKMTLDDLIGLKSVKTNIKHIMNLIQVENKRGQETTVGHYIFQGNPGTGKTSVGRILGKTFSNMKYLPSGHFIEVSRDDLIGQYQGHTTQKTTAVLQKALGGVLFIDEAYSLINDDSDMFGLEAINTIVPFMENHRGEFILIIAGYTDALDNFLASNVGFKSRFDYTINFDDYRTIELYDIFKIFAKDFHWSSSVDSELKLIFKNMFKYKNKHFGNGREVRKLFEQIKRNQSTRIVAVINHLKYNDPMMYEIQPSDLKNI